MVRLYILLAVLVATPAVAAVSVVSADEETENSGFVSVDVRVWQDVRDDHALYISARAAGGSWRTLGTIPLPLDDGHSASGRLRYGDISIAVPAVDRFAGVDVRVWQDVNYGNAIYIGARLAGVPWDTLGTIPLPLADGHSSSGRFRYGDVTLSVPWLVSIEGTVTDLEGRPREGIALEAFPASTSDFRVGLGAARSTTSNDGSFSFSVPADSYYLRLVGTGARFPSYLGSEGQFAEVPESLKPLEVGADITGLVLTYGVISGSVRGIWQVSEDLHVRLGEPARNTGYFEPLRGAFAYIRAPGTYLLTIVCHVTDTLGWYGGETGFVTERAGATPIVLEAADVVGLVIDLPEDRPSCP
ncbi:MAG: carboxypeptidase regulatory-like domain-containing protein [Dehalococcoidia bacterium]|nr:carboxypeptidase regulatory-like domain-containing protein [Dehalococcoidia bacterium]MYD28065.1 carboxypeptidase regulatory-like domain-containing protein [Dehalococcoidia bacterium]